MIMQSPFLFNLDPSSLPEAHPFSNPVPTEPSAPDAPDELVERRPPPALSPPRAASPLTGLHTSPSVASILSFLVSSFQTPRWLLLRSLLSALIAVSSVFVHHWSALSVSVVTSVGLMDSFLLVLLLLFSSALHLPSPPASPLGRLVMVKLVLLYLSPRLAVTFEVLYLVAYLVGLVFVDVAVGLFSAVVAEAVLSLLQPLPPLALAYS